MTTTETFSWVGQNVPSIPKAPGALSELDYTFDWTDWLAADADTIQSATVTCSGGVTLASQVDAFPLVHIKVNGGTAGTTAKAICAITTAQGRKETRTMYFQIKDR